MVWILYYIIITFFFIKQGSVSKQARNIELYIAFYTQELQSTLNNLKQHFENKIKLVVNICARIENLKSKFHKSRTAANT